MADISVFESLRFAKALNKLSEAEQAIVENEIDKVMADPLLGEQKKGDLSHLWVHKFKIVTHEWLLGYNWNDGELTIHLLQLGSHANYYDNAKKKRKADITLMKS
jgi:mRNA-degrading endonuclease RelE of RelBE toxin-antitoxin system